MSVSYEQQMEAETQTQEAPPDGGQPAVDVAAMEKTVLVVERLVEIKGIGGAWLGRLIDRRREICKTLELQWKGNAIDNSCIPTGVFACKPYVSNRFGECYAFLDEDTRPRTSIRIHAGNTSADSRGCLLVGSHYGLLSGMPAVMNSKQTLKNLLDEFPDGFLLRIAEFA